MKKVLLIISIVLASSISIADTEIGAVKWTNGSNDVIKLRMAMKGYDASKVLSKISYGMLDVNNFCKTVVSIPKTEDSNVTCIKFKCNTILGTTKYAVFNTALGEMRFGKDSCKW